MPVEDLLASARDELLREPEGVLSLRTRAALWRALAQSCGPRLGYERRVDLNIACVRQVLDRWSARFPWDDGVERMLRLAAELAVGAVAEAFANQERDRFYTDVIDTRTYASDASPMFVGLAAANVVVEAMIRDNEDAIPDAADDEALDPESYDASYLCASAAAAGLNGRPADTEARRAFWRWYLDTAIPRIYGVDALGVAEPSRPQDSE